MNIEWNKVTWYSKLTAVMVFGGALFLGFYLGIEYQKNRISSENLPPIDIEQELKGVAQQSSLLSQCFFSKALSKANVDISEWETFDIKDAWLKIKHPKSISISFKENQADNSGYSNKTLGSFGKVSYDIKSSEYSYSAILTVYDLRTLRYTVGGAISWPISYEFSSKKWFERTSFSLGDYDFNECSPTAAGNTIAQQFPIYIHEEGDVGAFIKNYIILARYGTIIPIMADFEINGDYNSMDEQTLQALNEFKKELETIIWNVSFVEPKG